MQEYDDFLLQRSLTILWLTLMNRDKIANLQGFDELVFSIIFHIATMIIYFAYAHAVEVFA